MVVHEELGAVGVAGVVEEGDAGGEGGADTVPAEEAVPHVLLEVHLRKRLGLDQSAQKKKENLASMLDLKALKKQIIDQSLDL